MIMARPLSHSSIYDPYSYYSPSSDASCSYKPIYADSASSREHSRTRLTRSASIWSTSSICSDDSSLDDCDRDFAFQVDDDDEDDFRSPVSPAESSSSRTSWSSAASSSSRSSSSSRTEHAMTTSSSVPSSPERFKRSDRPRGPRPLPTLPTSQPSSPVSPPHIALPLPKVTPPLRLNVKLVPPPPSYEEAISAGVQEPSANPLCGTLRLADDFPLNADAAASGLFASPVEDTIDWARIEEFIARCDG